MGKASGFADEDVHRPALLSKETKVYPPGERSLTSRHCRRFLDAITRPQPRVRRRMMRFVSAFNSWAHNLDGVRPGLASKAELHPPATTSMTGRFWPVSYPKSFAPGAISGSIRLRLLPDSRQG